MRDQERNRTWILLLTAVIWGAAFVAQSVGGDAAGPYAFNALRNYIGAIVLVPVILFRNKKGLSQDTSSPDAKRTLLIGGIACGAALCVASNLQQVALNMGSGTGNAGFLTSIYILMVPILGIILKKKCPANVWAAVGIALVGLYFLCINGEFRLEQSDILLLLCAFVFSIQILCIDHFSPLTDVIKLAALEFLFCALFSSVPMFFIDMGHSVQGFLRVMSVFSQSGPLISLLYAGVLSSGVAYTLQVVAQKNANPAVASLLMSLESVFSAVFGLLLLHQVMTGREVFGCAMIFAAVLIAQIRAKGDRSG